MAGAETPASMVGNYKAGGSANRHATGPIAAFAHLFHIVLVGVDQFVVIFFPRIALVLRVSRTAQVASQFLLRFKHIREIGVPWVVIEPAIGSLRISVLSSGPSANGAALAAAAVIAATENMRVLARACIFRLLGFALQNGNDGIPTFHPCLS